VKPQIESLYTGRAAPDLARLVAAAAAAHPGTPLFSDDGWPERVGPVSDIGTFWHAVDDLAARLWTAGVRPRQYVAVVLANHPRIQLASFAAQRIGAIPALLSAAMPAEHLTASLETLHPAWTLVDDATASRGDEVPARIRAVSTPLWYAPRATAADRPTWVTELPEPGAYEVGVLRPDEVTLVTHTSGTTSVPKLVAHSTHSIHQHAAPQIGLIQEFGSERLAVKSLSYVHARATSAFLTALVVGQPLGLLTDNRPERAGDVLATLRPHSLEAHPNTYISWEELAGRADRPMASVARFSSTFDAIHPRTVRAMLAGSEVPDAFFLQAYGQTETGPVAARAMRRDDPLGFDTRVVGAAAPGREARVVDANGVPVAAGHAGFIETRSDSQMLGYLGRETASDHDGWWPMGDWGRLRTDGAIELLDRVVDVIPGVESTLALEDALLDTFAELQEIVVLEGTAGCRVVAVAKPGRVVEADQVRKRACDLGMAEVELTVMDPGALPMTGSQKVRRSTLRQMLEARS
jgi:acyl-coenzyme A synthetase/AMP-(fatty) acid ligase